MNETIIRPLQQSDKAQWAGLWRDYLTFYETQLPDTVFDACFTRNIDPECANQNAFVAQQNGTLLGLVHYIYHPHNWRPEGVCYLQDLYVVPEMRGAGLGRKLIDAVYKAADAGGTPSVYWLTQDFNHTARALYDRIANKTPFIVYRR